MEGNKARKENKGETEEGVAILGKFVPSEADTFAMSEEQQGDQSEEKLGENLTHPHFERP